MSPAPAFLTSDEVTRELSRVADRLRVVGPRFAARDTPEAEETLTVVRGSLQRLADAAAIAEGRPRRTVPALAPHALADQTLVLGYDVLDAARAIRETGDEDRATAMLAETGALLETLRRTL